MPAVGAATKRVPLGPEGAIQARHLGLRRRRRTVSPASEGREITVSFFPGREERGTERGQSLESELILVETRVESLGCLPRLAVS